MFYWHFFFLSLVFATTTVLEIFYRQDLWEKALLLVPPAELEIFWQNFAAKALLLVPPTELEMTKVSNKSRQQKSATKVVNKSRQQKLATKVGNKSRQQKSATKVGNKVTNTVKFATVEPLTSTERLSTVSSPFMNFYRTNNLNEFKFEFQRQLLDSKDWKKMYSVRAPL